MATQFSPNRADQEAWNRFKDYIRAAKRVLGEMSTDAFRNACIDAAVHDCAGGSGVDIRIKQSGIPDGDYPTASSRADFTGAVTAGHNYNSFSGT